MMLRSVLFLAVAASVMQAGSLSAQQAASRVQCPAVAPTEWGGKRGVLNGVQVISAKRGETIDETAPPDLVPDEQRTRSGILHSVWRMNSDGPEWLFQVWCHYAGTPRVLKLDAPVVK